MGMDIGKPVKENVGQKAEAVGRKGTSLMRSVETVMLAGVAIKLAEDLSGPKMKVGTPLLDAAGNRGEVVGNSRGELLRTVVAESMVIGAFMLAQDLATQTPQQNMGMQNKNTQKPNI